METDAERSGVQSTRREETRKELLAAGRRLFALKGYDGTTIDEVVLTAAVSRGAFYFEFEDKKALFAAVVEHAQRSIREFMEEVLENGEEDPFGTLFELATAFLEAASEPNTHRIVYVDGPVVLGWHDWRAIERAQPLTCIENAVREAMKAGAIDPLPIDALASMLAAALTDAAMMLGRDDAGAKPSELLRVIGYLLSGLRSTPAAGEDVADEGVTGEDGSEDGLEPTA